MCMLGGQSRRGIGGGGEWEWAPTMPPRGDGYGGEGGAPAAAPGQAEEDEATEREGECERGGEGGGGRERAAGEAVDGGRGSGRGHEAEEEQRAGIRHGEVARQCGQAHQQGGRAEKPRGGNCGPDCGRQVARRDSLGQGARGRDHQCRLHPGRAARRPSHSLLISLCRRQCHPLTAAQGSNDQFFTRHLVGGGKCFAFLITQARAGAQFRSRV
jgi:hypothetical protein